MQHLASALTIGMQQAGIVHRRQLRAVGIDWRAEDHLTSAGLLVADGLGVLRIAGSPTTWDQLCWAGVVTARPGSWVSRRSAARLHAIGRFGLTGQVDIEQPAQRSGVTVSGTPHRSSNMPAHHRTEVRGIPVTTVERTVFDLAGMVSSKRYRRGLPSLRLGQVARTLDDAIGTGVAVQRFEALLAEHGGRGRGGTVVLRGLLDERGEGLAVTESDLEDLLLGVLVRFGLPIPVLQRNLGGTEDRVGRVDFLYARQRLVIEADGRKNHTALLDRESDAWRDLELSAAGFRVVRVTWRQLQQEPKRFARALRLLLSDTPA